MLIYAFANDVVHRSAKFPLIRDNTWTAILLADRGLPNV